MSAPSIAARPGRSGAAPAPAPAPRGLPLAAKLAMALVGLVTLVLLINGAVNLWLNYVEAKRAAVEVQQEKAQAVAERVNGFVSDLESQIGWTTRAEWRLVAPEQQRYDFNRLLRQAPALTEVSYLDPAGREQLRVSRLEADAVKSGRDVSAEPRFKQAVADKVWFGPVYFRRGSEPYMTVAVAHAGRDPGVTAAEVNLKLVWDVITDIRIGQEGYAFVVNSQGRLVAHPDLSLVLKGLDLSTLPQVANALGSAAGTGEIVTALDGSRVLSAHAPIGRLGWIVLVQLPVAEALAPVYTSLAQTAALLGLGLLLAIVVGTALARRMTVPIRLLERGAAEIGAGRFEHRIAIPSGDEIGRLAARFNAMAGELALSQERSERIGRLKRFLAPQVAELVERAGNDGVLVGRRVEVVTIFGDLRGFTAFSASAEAEAVMPVLSEYYDALSYVITDHGATLTHFAGDGLMVLVNAPVPCPHPAASAVRLALAMQGAVQALRAGWMARGYEMGFGVGAAMGDATVGGIGTADRLVYTAVGPVVNLASRLCAAAENDQILIDAVLANSLPPEIEVTPLGPRTLRGLPSEVDVAAVGRPKSPGGIELGQPDAA